MTMHEQRITSAPSLSPEWIERAKAGDQAAYTELYRQTSPALYRTIRSMVRDEDLAWDIQQNTYIRAFRALDKLENPAAFLPWLRRIAVNETATVMAKTQPLTFTELADENGELPQFAETREAYQPELNLDRQETARLVREILETLPREQQLIVGMFYYEGLSIQEISEALHIAPGTVKAQLYRGRKRIEAGVLDLEKQGVKLYGLAPLPFLLALLRGIEPAAGMEARTLASVLAGIGKANVATAAASAAGTAGATVRTAASAASAESAAAGANGGAAVITAKAAKAGFLHTLAGKIVLGAAALTMVGSGVLTYSLLHKDNTPNLSDIRPQQITQELVENTPATEEVPFDGQLDLIPDVLIDEAGLKVTPRDLDSQGNHTVTYTVENNTGRDLNLSFEEIAVNGCMVSGSGELFGLGPETGVLYLTEEDLELYGISTLEQISAVMVFTDSDTGEEVYRSKPVTTKTTAWRGDPVFDESGRLVYDNYGIRIYTDRVEGNDGSSKPCLYMTIVNRSDQAIEVGEVFANSVINRYVCPVTFKGFATVTPGNCGIVAASVRGDYQEQHHISFINDFDMGFEIKKAGTWDCIDETEVYNIWTNPDPLPDVPYDPDDCTPLLEQNGVTVVALNWERTYDNDFKLEYYIDNHSGQDLVMTFADFRINGVPVSNLATMYVDENRRGFSTLSVWGDDLEEAGIDTISEITLRVYLKYQSNWDEYLVGDPVSISINEGQ